MRTMLYRLEDHFGTVSEVSAPGWRRALAGILSGLCATAGDLISAAPTSLDPPGRAR